ncbi:unnamed protein product [Ilex paraguariensis]|uniref:Histone acetyltransferase n=1 Tax=Ilex paraguariensis TaxID=185542 RepID=A0ABC8TFK9_9AQUA
MSWILDVLTPQFTYGSTASWTSILFAASVIGLNNPVEWRQHHNELSDMTAIKAEDILATLQSLELIQYRKGQHVICADPKVLDRHLKAAGRGGLEVDVSKLIWTPYKEQN